MALHGRSTTLPVWEDDFLHVVGHEKIIEASELIPLEECFLSPEGGRQTHSFMLPICIPNNSKPSLVIHETKSLAAGAWRHRAGEWQALTCRDQSSQRTDRGQTQLLCIMFYWAKRVRAAAHGCLGKKEPSCLLRHKVLVCLSSAGSKIFV